MARWGFSVPVEFLTDAQAATYGSYAGPPSVAELDRCFLLDDKARGLIESKRLPHTRLGYAVQLATLLFIGRFLADPTDVPTEVVDYLAEQLDIADPSCVKDYRVRETTRLEHATQIRDAYGFVEFTAEADELARWVDDRAWTTGDGPKALFDGAVVWLREHWVLLRGVHPGPAGGPGPGRGDGAAVGHPRRPADRGAGDRVGAAAGGP